MSQPRVNISLDRTRRVYEPGELVSFEVRVFSTDRPSAVEVSILWYTEGKGDEDLAVHFFDRVESSTALTDFTGPHRYSVALPHSPLSYKGVIVKIYWCVRVRVFLGRGRDFVAEEGFQLGRIPAAAPVSP